VNKNYLYVLPLALAMVAFSGQSVAQGKDPECKGEPQAPTINLNFAARAKKDKIDKECALAHLGSTIVFRLTPKKGLDLNSVTIEPENPLDTWLRASNNMVNDLIIIRIPGQHDTEKAPSDRIYTDHIYVIKVNGIVVDPRIQVER
jgi:hypothetical protein